MRNFLSPEENIIQPAGLGLGSLTAEFLLNSSAPSTLYNLIRHFVVKLRPVQHLERNQLHSCSILIIQITTYIPRQKMSRNDINVFTKNLLTVYYAETATGGSGPRSFGRNRYGPYRIVYTVQTIRNSLFPKFLLGARLRNTTSNLG